MNERMISAPDTKQTSSNVEKEEWRDKPYLKFESNIKRVQEVEKLIQKHGSDGTLATAVAKYYEEELAKNPLLEKQLDALSSLQTELDGIEDELEILIGADSDKANQRHSELTSHSEIISEKIELLRSDPDIMFSVNLFDGIVELHRRAMEIEKCKEDPVEYMKKNGMGFPYEEIIYSDASVTFIISPEILDKHLNQSKFEGIHYSWSIISLVRKNPDLDQMKETVDHENKHALFESFFMYQADVFTMEDVQKVFSRILRMSELGAPKEQTRVMLEAFKSKIWQKYLSGIKNELVANYEGLKNGVFSSDFVIYLEIFLWIKEMESKSEGAVSNMFKEAHERLQEEAHKFYKQLSDILFLAGETDLSEDVHSAMLLLDPLDYGKIEQYLIWKTGKEKYSTYQAIRGIIRAPFFTETKYSSKTGTPETILIDKINSSNNPLVQASKLESPLDGLNKENVARFSLDELAKINLTEEEKSKFEKVVNEILADVHNVASIILEDPVYVSVYLDKLTKIFQMVGITISEEQTRKSVWSQYVYDKTDPFLKAKDIQSVIKLVQDIPVSEKKYFSDASIAFKEKLQEYDLLEDQEWQKVLQMIESV